MGFCQRPETLCVQALVAQAAVEIIREGIVRCVSGWLKSSVTPFVSSAVLRLRGKFEGVLPTRMVPDLPHSFLFQILVRRRPASEHSESFQGQGRGGVSGVGARGG